MASVVRMRSKPAGPSITAASSVRPSPPGAASGAKNRAIRSNSPMGGWVIFRQKLFRSKRTSEAVEDTIHHARLAAREKRIAQPQIFADDDSRRDIGPRQQFISPDAQDRPQHHLEPLQRPFRAQGGGNHAVELGKAARRTAHEIGEERQIRLAPIFALPLPFFLPFLLVAKTESSEFGDHALGATAGDLDLIKRLDRGKPRRRALAPGTRTRGLGFFAHVSTRPKWRFKSIMARQARAASPPLFLRSMRARARACASFSTVRMPNPSAR